MYIIVSKSRNYRGKKKGEIVMEGYDVRPTTIGHEIHISRFVLLFMLCKKIISKDDIIVTRNNERFFLYSEIFDNIIGYDDLPENIDEKEIIDITDFNIICENTNTENIILLESQFEILKNFRKNNIEIRTEEFNNLFSKIHYKQLEKITNDYVVVHDRQVYYDIKYLQDRCNHIETINIIEDLLINYPNLDIILFSSSKNIIFNNEKIKLIDRVDDYAAYMKNEKCKGVISLFSGAGQLSQYCHDKCIYYYCSVYDFYNGLDAETIYKIANDEKNLYMFFDLKKITHANVYISDNYINLLKFLKNEQKEYFSNNNNFVKKNEIYRI
jgi:hypothetical protein